MVSAARWTERMNERTNDRASTVTLAHAPRVNNYYYFLLLDQQKTASQVLDERRQ